MPSQITPTDQCALFHLPLALRLSPLILSNMDPRNIYLTAAIASNTACMFGYGTGYIGGILVLPSFNRHFALDQVSEHDRAAVQSLIVSIWLLGAFIGVLCAFPVCSRLGRRKCLIFCAFIYVLGVALQLEPNAGSIIAFDAGRLLSGIGVGAGTLVAPLYISEISLPSNRGMLLASWQVSMQVSSLVGFWGAYISHRCLPDTTAWQWGIPVSLQLAPGLALLLGSTVIPESPTWLAERHELNELLKVHAWLRREDASSPEVKSEVEDYHGTVVHRRRLASLRAEKSFLGEICSRPIRKRLICGVGLMTLMTLSGTNALNFYAPVVFMSAGFTSTSASLFLTGLFGLAKLAAALSFMFYVVRIGGNRLWLIVATSICSVSLLILAFCVRTFEARTLEDGFSIVGIVACLMVFIFAFFFGIGHGPIAWNFCAEVFPTDLSTKCCAITTCAQWLFQVVNAVATPLLLSSAGWYTWIIFHCINALTLVFCVFYIPETRGVPLGAAMDAAFGDVPEAKSHSGENIEDAARDSDEETSFLQITEDT